MAMSASKVNQNWVSDILSTMQSAGKDFNSPDIMLGEVVTPPPSLTIKVGNIVLYPEQLLVADYLLPGYKRAYYQDGVMHFKAMADSELSGQTKDSSVPSAVVGDHGSHAHGSHNHNLQSIDVTTTKENFFAHGDGKDPVVTDARFKGTDAAEKYFYFTDTLKPKDLVLVQQMPDSHYFVVKNRLIRMEDVLKAKG